MKINYLWCFVLLMFSYTHAQHIDYLSPSTGEVETYSSINELYEAELSLPLPNYQPKTTPFKSGCGSGDVVITSQAEINALSGCTEITGDLIVDGNNISAGAETITDLSPLNSLTTISGNILFSNLPEVSALPTLESLTQLNGSYRVSNMVSLASLPNFPNQAVINGNVQFSNLQLITQLPVGLSQITTINEGADVIDNPANRGDFHLATLPALTSYPNFDNLTQINGGLTLTSLPLSALPVFDNLNHNYPKVVSI